jgi:GNAT superfamily N-acetyltransferase
VATETATRRLEVRLAAPGDAAAVAAIHIVAWRRAYAHVVPAAALTGIPPGDREAMWRGLIAGGGRRRRVLVAGAPGGAPRGFAAWSPTRDADGDPSATAELCAIYVHPDAWGGGLGRALVEHGIALARADGFERATLWVVRDNARARRFYERAGWTPDGGRREEPVLGAPVAQVRYATDLRRPPAAQAPAG